MKMKYKNSMFVKTFIVLGLVIAACVSSVGVFAITVQASSDPTKISDLNGSYGLNMGISNLTQKPEVNKAGMGSTTVKFDLQGKGVDVADALKRYAKTIEEISNGETVNTEVVMSTEKNKTVTVKYFASSPMDYSNGSFNTVKQVISRLNNTTLESVYLEIEPTLSGHRTIIVEGETINIDSKDYTVYQNFNLSLYNDVVKVLGVNNGEVFTVSYRNTIKEEAKTDRVSVEVTHMFDSLSSMEQIISDDKIWKDTNSLASSVLYSKLGATKIEYFSTQKINQAKLMITVPDEGEEALTKRINLLKKASVVNTDYVTVPGPYSVAFRYGDNGATAYTIYGYYAKQ